jgi:hypothetical protein
VEGLVVDAVRWCVRKFAVVSGVLFFATFGAARSAQAATYYIDCAQGSDGNAGTSKAAPWQHHPYMTGFGGRYTHSAGDQFIFKGGVTCNSTNFPMVINAGGSNSNPDYYGVDQTWFASGSWTHYSTPNTAA